QSSPLTAVAARTRPARSSATVRSSGAGSFSRLWYSRCTSVAAVAPLPRIRFRLPGARPRTTLPTLTYDVLGDALLQVLPARQLVLEVLQRHLVREVLLQMVGEHVRRQIAPLDVGRQHQRQPLVDVR